MPLGLTDAQKNYAGPVVWLAIITDPITVPPNPQTVRYYGEDLVVVASKTYEPYLRIDAGPELDRSMKAKSAEVTLLNADLAVGGLMYAEDWEGHLCQLLEYLMGLGVAVERFRGRLGDAQQTDEGVKFRVTSEPDAGQIDAQQRIYSADCTLRFARDQCGYDGAASTVTEELAERTADVHTATTIGDTTLAMTVDVHKNRYVVITAGTGKGQKRRVFSNDATTIEVINRFSTTPDGTSKFKVFTFSAGAPKFLFTSASSVHQATADVHTARTIGYTGLALPTNAHAADTVAIVSGTGAGNARKIGSNTATTITLDAGEEDFDPAPDATSVFRVLFRACPRDFGQSCEMRARAHRFNGFPTLTPDFRATLAPTSDEYVPQYDYETGQWY